MGRPVSGASAEAESTEDVPDLTAWGTWTDPDRLVIERARIQAYAAATNDPTPSHRAGERAGPVFAVVPAWRTAFPLLLSTLSPALQMRTLHGEQDIILHRPLEPGMVLETRAMLTAVRSNSSGTTLTARALSNTSDGAPVVDQYTTLFVRGIRLPDRGEGSPARLVVDPAHVPPREFVDVLDADQTQRYAVAAGDGERIHLDVEVARAAGFPDLINHGNCTFAIAARHVLDTVCESDVRRLRRIAVRFSRAVLLSDEVRTRVMVPPQGSRASLWESSVQGGELCLKNGYVETW